MSGGYRLDSDGDVETSVPQPVYEFITAPRLKAWDQTSLVTWSRERQRYEAKIAERCAVTGETPERICARIKSCFDADILATIARYVLFKPVQEVSDSELQAEIDSHLKNAHVPDLDRLFRETLKMDLRNDDCDGSRYSQNPSLYSQIAHTYFHTFVGQTARFDQMEFPLMQAQSATDVCTTSSSPFEILRHVARIKRSPIKRSPSHGCPERRTLLPRLRGPSLASAHPQLGAPALQAAQVLISEVILTRKGGRNARCSIRREVLV